MISLYLAILNKGWLRSEMTYYVIPQMLNTKGVDVYWEDPVLSRGHPIDSNRSSIAKRFLETNRQFLLMIDDDVVPMHNPVELVYANRDILGCPTLVRQNARCINWNVYEPGHDDGYMAVDLHRAGSDGDVAPVSIVGTGCILIKRKVLEKLGPRAFTIERDENGITKYGTDFAFCRRAKEAGFKIETTPWRRCEHFKESGLCDVLGYDQMDKLSSENAKYKICWGGMAIQSLDWDFLKTLVTDEKIDSVLEFGSGLSSLLMSEYVEVDSYETDATVSSFLSSKINGNWLNLKFWNGKELSLKRHYDLAFIDGPAGGKNRENAFKLAALHADRIVVHDAGRPHEKLFQKRILRENFKLVSWNGSHQQHCALWERKNL
ncbi:MAG: glycosyltransferase family 2 protein [Candidatus Thorarchaeota archaeon]|jgi:hypothetical protein